MTISRQRRTRPTRREFLIGAGSLLALGGCGGGGGAGSSEEASGQKRAVEHKYGSTEVPENLGRVVTVGLTDQDYALALGVKPVAVTEWYGEYDHAAWPCTREALGDANPEVMPRNNDQLDFERLAALEPDLIIGISSGMTRDDYDTLSEFVPTLPQSHRWADYGVLWQNQTSVIGRALGREDRTNSSRTSKGVSARPGKRTQTWRGRRSP